MTALNSICNKDWPLDPNSYDLLDDCGRGVSATVHRSLCKPLNEIIAIKKMNLESMNCDLDEIIHEAQTMRQYSHPNVLPLYCSFVAGQDLWMVMPFVAGGSVLHIMKYNYPEGLDEIVIATIMRDVLKALEYVHKQGSIHRDVKAGNILVDKDGAVKLADFGVAATMERGASWGHDKMSRMTFVGTPLVSNPSLPHRAWLPGPRADTGAPRVVPLVGRVGCWPPQTRVGSEPTSTTPTSDTARSTGSGRRVVRTACTAWMAPEVMEQTEGYDFSADIWSFGITLLEMAYGCAPFAKFPPMKVLLMTLQNPPPTLDDKGTKHFSKNMRDLVTRCLQKEPQKRPTATQLLEHKFFKQGRDDEYLGRNLMANLPSLAERVTLIRQGKAATSADINDKNLAKSQEEYVKGVSSWNFDVSALKAAAAMEPDAAALPTITETEEGDLLQSLASVSVSALFSSQSPPATASTLAPSLAPSVCFNNTVSVMQSPQAAAAAAASAAAFAPSTYSNSGGGAALPAYVSFPQSGEGTPVRSTTPSLLGAGNSGTHSTPAFASAFANIAQHQGQYQQPHSGSSIAASAAARSSLSSASLQESTFGTASFLPAGISIPDLASHEYSSQTSANGRSSTPGTAFAEAPMSPGTADGRGSSSSPATMSREGSVLTSTLAQIATTPTAVKQKKGRFNVYEHGEVVPPMSPPNPHPALMEAFATMARTEQALSNLGAAATPLPPTPSTASTAAAAAAAAAGLSGTSFLISSSRASEDGFGRSNSSLLTAHRSMLDATTHSGSTLATDLRELTLNGASSTGSGGREFEESVTSVETKRGRFKIVSDSTERWLQEPRRRRHGRPSRRPDGSPTPAPSSLVTLPVTVILPKLQELMDHAAAHQAAIMRLMGAVQDAERGKSPVLLSRNQSGRVPLFDRTESDAVDDMKAQMHDMRARMATLEDDNRALRSRNAMLESAIIHSRGQPANLLPHPHPHPHPHLSASSSRHDLSHSLHHPHPHGDGGGGGGSSSGGNPSHPRQPQPDGRFASTTQVSYLDVDPHHLGTNSHSQSTEHTPTASGRASPHASNASGGGAADHETLSMQRSGSGHGLASAQQHQQRPDLAEEWVGQQTAMQHEPVQAKQ
ncbi:MAG: hypothetical protein WDW36_005843 [Sanguina aurantia]